MSARLQKKISVRSLFTEDNASSGKARGLSPTNMFLLKSSWCYPLFVAVLFILSSVFIDSVTIRLIISIVLAVFPWRESMIKVFSGRYRNIRTQLLVLLQVLCTSVSSGYSIEKSFELVRPVIEHTFGRKSVLIKPLINLENNLRMHISLEESLRVFADEIGFPETVPVFHALSISGRIGNNSLAILRSSCQMLSEMNSVESEIAALNAGKNAEAVMLCIMPFAITFALNQMSRDYLTMAKNTPTGSVLLMVAFGLCVISAALLFRFISHSASDRPLKDKNISNDRKARKYPLADLAIRILPQGISSSRHELFSELSGDPKAHYEKFIQKQIISVTVVTILTYLILTISGKPVLLTVLAPVAVIVLNNRDIHREAELKREYLMKDIPLFMCLMSTLLEAGMQLPKSIEICSKAFEEKGALSEEINNLRAMILAGTSASDAVEKLSLRIQIPEAQAALLLVARYGRLGTSEVLNLLSLQASACWNLCRNAARKKQEREALGLLLPMTLDFICVLLVAMTPAIISLGI
ncbi:Flp pilus assembly protein TadB [Ruminococcaceae bacterium YRB3002]|nr:Flp pilus assembly protein TadB [Ruminococcaceae bacterium YRB3002]